MALLAEPRAHLIYCKDLGNTEIVPRLLLPTLDCVGWFFSGFDGKPSSSYEVPDA